MLPCNLITRMLHRNVLFLFFLPNYYVTIQQLHCSGSSSTNTELGYTLHKCIHCNIIFHGSQWYYCTLFPCSVFKMCYLHPGSIVPFLQQVQHMQCKTKLFFVIVLLKCNIFKQLLHNSMYYIFQLFQLFEMMTLWRAQKQNN